VASITKVIPEAKGLNLTYNKPKYPSPLYRHLPACTKNVSLIVCEATVDGCQVAGTCQTIIEKLLFRHPRVEARTFARLLLNPDLTVRIRAAPLPATCAGESTPQRCHMPQCYDIAIRFFCYLGTMRGGVLYKFSRNDTGGEVSKDEYKERSRSLNGPGIDGTCGEKVSDLPRTPLTRLNRKGYLELETAGFRGPVR
jgi:hypothetical protein